jgi:hypothetical protein
MNDIQTVRPSWWYCAFGGALIMAGIGLFLYFLFHGVFHITDDLTQIVAPGEKDLTLKSKLKYTIFLERESVVDGRIYSTNESLSGLTCFVISQTSGNKIDLYHPTATTSYELGGRSGRSVLEFVTEEAGVYRIACDYDEGSHGPKAVLAVGAGMAERIISMVFRCLASMFGGMTLGAAIIVAVAILRERASRRLARAGRAPV